MTDFSSSDMSSSDKNMRRASSPDDGTFASQQDFLDSLAPVPLETVEVNNRKCGYCWRNYGEANPDQDDAEAPVQFKKCNHVFGEQCMRLLFALRDPVRADLKLLSFAPGSRGADLGSRLRSYVESRGVEKSALLTGGSREKDFILMLQDLRPAASVSDQIHKTGIKLLGSVWYGLYYEMYVQLDAQPGKIHIFENAIVLDREITAAEKSPGPSYWNPTLPSPSSLLTAHFGLNNDKPVCFGTSHLQPYYNSPPDIPNPFSYDPSLFEKWDAEDIETMKKNMFPKQADSEDETFAELLDKDTEVSLAKMKMTSPIDDEMQQKKLSGGSQKEQQLYLGNYQSLAEKNLQKEVQTIMPKNPSQLTKEELDKEVDDFVQQQLKQSSTWKDALATQSKLDGLICKQKELVANAAQAQSKHKNLILPTIASSQGYTPAQSTDSSAPPSPKGSKPIVPAFMMPGIPIPPTPTPQEILKKNQAFKKKQAKLQAESQEKRYNLFTMQLARTFAEVYAAYERYLIEDAIAVGRSPPFKKLRLADSKHPLTTGASLDESAAPDSPPGTKYELVRPQVVNLIGTVHDGTKNDKGLEVNQPFPYGVAHDDSDSDDDAMDDDKLETLLAGRVIFLKRVMCDRCFRAGPYVCAPPAPEFVFWKDKKNVPNDCPRCRRILFRK